MDFRLRKLRLALWLMGLGTLLSLAWHGWQGWGLGRPYPYNTYLSTPAHRFNDFTMNVKASRLACPYDIKMVGLYFPATYVLLKPFSWLPHRLALGLFLAGSLLGALWLQMRVLRDLIPAAVPRLLVVLALTGCSFAVTLCLDRGNPELIMAVLIGLAIFLCRRRHFAAAAALIGLTMCLKLYTALLLVVFLRRRHLRYIVLPVAGFVAASLLSLASFAHPLWQNLVRWPQNFRVYNYFYVVFNEGLAGSSSLWNLTKVTFLSLDRAGWMGLNLDPARDPRHFVLAIEILSAFYESVLLLFLVAAVAFILFVERAFFRRFLYLLILTPFASQSGADYRLLYFHLALVLLILLPDRRPRDLGVVALLALTLLPKKEIFLTWLGPTDTTFRDVAVAVLINPVLILLAILLLAGDTVQQRVPGWALQRLRGLLELATGWFRRPAPSEA